MKEEIQDGADCIDEGEKEEEEGGLQGEKRQLDAEGDGEEEDNQIILTWDCLMFLGMQESDHIFVSSCMIAIYRRWCVIYFEKSMFLLFLPYSN